MLKKIYLSKIGLLISIVLNFLGYLRRPFMIYGYFNRPQKKFFKKTRISSSAVILSGSNLDIQDNVWIGHFSVLDASCGIHIGEGVQTGNSVAFYTHSSHDSIRLLGKRYMYCDATDRVGYKKGAIFVGEYSFIGSHSIVFYGVTIGKGSLICAGSVLTSSVPDFSIVSGNPAKIIGSTLLKDEKYFFEKIVQDNYFDREKAIEFKSRCEALNSEVGTPNE